MFEGKINKKYLIETPNGFKPFLGIKKLVKPESLTITFSDNSVLTCSTNHKVKTITGFKQCSKLNIGDLVHNNITTISVENIKINTNLIELFDPIEVFNGNQYYSNKIVSHNCSFLGTGDTFIDGEILKQLKANENQEYTTRFNNRLRIWKQSDPHHDYVIGVDTSLGRGLDSSVAQVIDLFTGEQVAEFKSNKTPINEFASILFQIGNEYNTAYVIPERNNIGHNLIYELKEVQQYENVFLDDKHEAGIQLADQNRRQMLVQMDDAIRLNKIKLNSDRTIDELLTFIIDENGKYIADVNCHDDLVMALTFAVFGFNEIRANTPMLQDRPNDDNKFNPPISKAKYLIKTPSGFIEEEDLRWLIS